MICPICSGKGIIREIIKSNRYEDYDAYEYCYNCSGIGKINWIENVLGGSHVKRSKMTEQEYELFVSNERKYFSMSDSKKKGIL